MFDNDFIANLPMNLSRKNFENRLVASDEVIGKIIKI